MRNLSAVQEISKFFDQGGECICTLSPTFTDEVLSEERQLIKWLGIFQVGIFWVEIFQGGGAGVGGFSSGEFDGSEFSGWKFSRGEFS